MSEKTYFSLGVLSTALYGTLGGFSKVASAINEKFGEMPREEITTGELISLCTAIGIGVATFGLTKLIGYCYNESQKPEQETSWLFNRLQ